MPRHFAALGYDLQDKDALRSLARDAARHGDLWRAARPGLRPLNFFWDLGRGLGVWTYAEESAEDPDSPITITGCVPSFLPEDTLSLAAYRLARTRESGGELLLSARVAETGARIEAALINAAIRPELPVRGGELGVHVAGLALESECFETEAAPRLVSPNGEEAKTSALLPLDRDGHHRLFGEIEAVREVVNFQTGRRLWCLLVKTEGLSLTVVAPTTQLPRPPLRGEVYVGTVWLIANLPARMKRS